MPAESPWRIRIYDVNDNMSFKYPIEHIMGDAELREFLNQSELNIDEDEKTRFLQVGDLVKAAGRMYRVVKIYLKMYDYELRRSGTGSELHVLVGAEQVHSS